MEKFNPYDPKYKKVEDLPKEEQDNFKNVEGGFVRNSALEKEEAEYEADKISKEKIAKISELGKKVIEEAKKYSDEEIKNLNLTKGYEDNIDFSYTQFSYNGLRSLEYNLPSEELKNFKESLSKHTLIDLACGIDVETTLKLFFKVKNQFKKLEDFFPEPIEYVGVDKTRLSAGRIRDNFLNDKIKLKDRTDLIEFLRTCPDNSANILLGGFDYDISYPKGEDDEYRAILISEISRVLAKGGYVLFTESPPRGTWEGKWVEPKDFGLVEIADSIILRTAGSAYLYKKPE